MNPTATALRRRSLGRLAAIAIAPFLALNACGVLQSSATGTIKTAVAGGKSAVISVENSNIEVIKDPNASGVEVTAEVRCYGDDQAEADARLKATTLVAQSDADGKVQITVSIPKRKTTGWININSDVTHVTVRAADLSGIVATTSNGTVTIGAFSGEAKLESSNGSIVVNGHTGSVNAMTSNGSIDVRGASSVIAESSNGSISVVLGEGATGDLDLETSNGSVTLDLSPAWQGTLSADTSLGSVNLSGGTVTGSDDSKTMIVGDATKAKATIDTSNGRIIVRKAK